jgi:hypothetical protein
MKSLVLGRSAGDLRLSEVKSPTPAFRSTSNKQGKHPKLHGVLSELLSKSREANDLGEKRQEKNELLLSVLRHRSVAIVLPEGPWWSATNTTSTFAAPSRL